MPQRLIDLIRHGEVEGGGCFRGRRDDPLSAAGWAQMSAAISAVIAEAAAGQHGANVHGAAPWDRLLTSPASRCARFAEQLGERLGLDVEPVTDFRERDFGAWEGLRADQLPLSDLGRFWADPGAYDPPDSEPFSVFHQRVLAAWQDLRGQGGEHPLLITHGGVIRVILGEVLGLATARLILLEVPPASRTRLRLPTGEGLPSLVSHGCAPWARDR
jgi:alpha-ribazole phosphatase